MGMRRSPVVSIPSDALTMPHHAHDVVGREATAWILRIG
jgi:hypothetical protein